ncbi:MAG TPA: hypothetical protein VL522_03900 [Bordetella sp.]|nr:hypothetical protein [Bordetella sp.]
MPVSDQIVSLTLALQNETGSMVLALDNDSVAPGTAAVAAHVSPLPKTMFWRFSGRGPIVSALSPRAALTMRQDNTGAVVVYPPQPGNPSFQSWTMTDEGLIHNMDSTQVLTVSVEDGIAALTMFSVVEGGAAIGIYQHWNMTPLAAP